MHKTTSLLEISFSSLVLGFLPILGLFDLIKNVPNFDILTDFFLYKFETINEKNSSTLAGYIIYQTQTFPEVGQTFRFNDISFEILNKKKNQITQLKVIIPEKKKITH